MRGYFLTGCFAFARDNKGVINGRVLAQAMMWVPRVAVIILFPPFAPLLDALHFIVPRTPFRMATCAIPSGSNFQSRALSNLLWLALHWRKEREVEIFNPARI